MFDRKQKNLMKKKSTESGSTSGSAFVNAAIAKTSVTTTGNGAKAYSTSGNEFVDQLSSMGTMRQPRNFADIEKDCEMLWGLDKQLALRFNFFLRMQSRKTRFFDGTTSRQTQAGGELKHEGIMRMLWLHMKDEDLFFDNLATFVAAGSWKDIFEMLRYDLLSNKWEGRVLNWERFGQFILSGLADEGQVGLVAAYMPKITSKAEEKSVQVQANTLIAKWLKNLLFGKDSGNFATYKQYRQLKSNANAKTWQGIISRRNYELLDFSKIHGRALNKLARSKFLDNQGLKDKYEAWATSDEVDTIKFTGYVHELFEKLPSSLSGIDKATQATINKQFNELVKKGGEKQSVNLITVLDTSYSMTSQAAGLNMTSMDVGYALAVYFSEFLTGTFKDAWIEFNSTAKMHRFSGNTALEKYYNRARGVVGGTNFQSVIDLFCNLRASGVAESEFPTGILCISDGEFNQASLNSTNVEVARKKLRKYFSKDFADNFVIILWNIPNTFYGGRSKAIFETNATAANTVFCSGYSAQIVKFILEAETAAEAFMKAMDQELLDRIVM